jgi:drug/metabolite transporter (DMT)-like permease
MSTLGLALLLVSACIHLVTHVAIKASRNRDAFVWWMLLWDAVLFAPVLVLLWEPFPAEAWKYILLSSVFEATYFFAIGKAYRGGDLSVVYPLARGSAVVFLLVWSVTLLHEQITRGGIGGVLVIAAGLYLINLPRLGAWREPLRSLRSSGPRWALFAGVSTSLYTAIDKVGIGFVQPFIYTYLALLVTLVWLTPVSFALVRWPELKRELRYSNWRAVLAGFTTMAAYALVLISMSLGTPATYAGAVREFSVVLGGIYGVTVLKEQGGRLRILGSVLVALGIALIGLLG